MSASPGRLVAREAVTRVRERSAYAHETLNALLTERGLDTRESAFASRIALGTIACRGTLDEAVRDLLSAPKRLESLVADCLAISAYELLFMRTPTHATVSQAVELVRAVQPKAAGLANAVLRRLASRAADFPWGDPQTDMEAAARLYGHPTWMAELFVEELGFEDAMAVMAANNEPAPLYVATLPFRADESEIRAGLTSGDVDVDESPLPHCLVALSPSAAIGSSALSDGRLIVADAGAQLAAACVPVTPGARIVELGAGRGTKSILIHARAARLGASVEVVAVDLHAFKLQQLTDAAEKVGSPPVSTVVADATDPDAAGLPEPGSVDAVLVDAPCSGLGTLRRHPDRRWRARRDEIATLAELGGKLLRTAASLVRPGGFVVYSTCTITRQENDEVVDAFLATEAGASFQNDDITSDVPEEWRRFVSPGGRFRSLPENAGPDGHFVARLVRKG